MQHPFSLLDWPTVADRDADYDATIQGMTQRSRGGQLIGAVARELVVETKKVASLGRWIPQPASQHGTDGMKLVLERGDHAEVSTATPNPPEEILVLLVAGRYQPSIGGHHVGRDEVVAGKAVFAVEPAETASEGETGDTGHRDNPEGSRQPERLRLVIELAQRQSCLSLHKSMHRIDPNTFHGRQVEH